MHSILKGYCSEGVCKCDPRISYCKLNHKCNNFTCQNGGSCIDIIEKNSTKPHCLCPPGLTGEFCEISYYCDKMGGEICGGKENKCKVFNNNYACDCESPNIGHGCKKGKFINDMFMNKVYNICFVFNHSFRRSLSWLFNASETRTAFRNK